MSTDMGGPRAMKAPLREVKCHTRFFFLHAYTTSDLRTFRRTCVHVRKECSLEISEEHSSDKVKPNFALAIEYLKILSHSRMK